MRRIPLDTALICTGCVAALLLIFTIGCGEPAKQPAERVPPRFTQEAVGSDLYLVTDTKSGKQYLKSYNGGFVELK